MFKTFKEDIQTGFAKDPAARSVLEVVSCYPGLHALWSHRLAQFLARCLSHSVVVRPVSPGAVVVEVPGRVEEDRQKPLGDLEHGELPGPISEKLKLTIDERDKLRQRIRQLENSRRAVLTVSGLEGQERGSGRRRWW